MLINYETTKQAPQLDPEFSIKLPIMDNNSVGVGKPDGTTITANEDGTMTASGGGSGATNDYATATNKPQINSVELVGNKTLDQLGIQAKGNYATTEQLADYATTEQLATKADSSQLANYATTEQLSNYLTTSTASSTYATKTELATKADSTALNAKADKSTTLAGYGITDAYTKTEADGKYATKTELSAKADSSQLANYLTTATASSTYATKTELSAKADTTALPAANTLMIGTAPTVADIDAGSVTELSAFIPLFNTILQQLRDRGVITQ